MIELKHIHKTFIRNDKPYSVLNDINLTIQKGEIFGIIGKSGAGKSTLLRCMNLLEKPDSGEVLIDAANLVSLSTNELRQARKQMGMIFQHHNLLASRNVFDNVALPLELLGIPLNERLSIVDELLELTAIDAQKHHYPQQLSGGQKQRVAIARALAIKPRVLLCDEATASLDADSTKSILALLKKINRTFSLTIILITHEIEVVKQICDRVGVIENGQLVEVGSTLTILTQPQTSAAKRLVAHHTDPFIHHSVTQHSKLVKLTFYGNHSDSHFLSDIAKKFAVDINIQQAQIEKIQDTTVGFTICEFIGNPEVLAAVMAYIKETNVTAEVL